MKEITATIMPMSAFPPDERSTFSTWAWQRRELTHFDMDIISYPRTVVARAEEDGSPLLYLPIHPILMCESLMCGPDTTKSQIAHGLLKVMAELDKAMRDTGMHEMYFVTQDDEFAEAATTDRGIGVLFTEVKGHVLKRKLPKE